MEMAGSDQSHKKRFSNLSYERMLLVVTLLVAAFVRFWHLDLMEFKADEAEACRLAYHVVGNPLPDGSNQFPLAGLTSRIGVRNPPLFIYLLALPLACSRSPFAAVGFIALCNVVAVWLCYCVGRRYFSPFVALVAAGLYAVSPWAIVFSRKIWAQDLLPVLLCLFLLAAHGFLVDKRPGLVAWLVVLAGVAIQVHFSALILLGVLAFVFVAGRGVFRWKWFWIGAAATLLLYLPYIFSLLAANGDDFSQLAGRQQYWGGRLPALGRFLLSLRYTFAVSSADATEFFTDIPVRFALPLSLVAGVAGLVGLIGLCFRDRAGPFFHARLMLLIWFVLPVLGLAVVGNAPFPHYFVVLYPLPFLGLAVALEKIVQRWRWWGGALLGAFLVGYTLFDVGVFRAITARGGSAADYGIAYAYKAAAMNFILSENRDCPFNLSTDFSLGGEVPLEYGFLLALEARASHWQPASSRPLRTYVLIDTLAVKLSPEGERIAQGLRRREFGPLTVYIVPLAAK